MGSQDSVDSFGQGKSLPRRVEDRIPLKGTHTDQEDLVGSLSKVVQADQPFGRSVDHPEQDIQVAWLARDLELAMAMRGYDLWRLEKTVEETVFVKVASILLADLGTPEFVWSLLCCLQDADKQGLVCRRQNLSEREIARLCK